MSNRIRRISRQLQTAAAATRCRGNAGAASDAPSIRDCRRGKLALLGWCGLISALVGPACSPEETKSQGGLVVATTTDLQIPKDVSHIGIQVLSTKGALRYENWYPLGSGAEENRLPATLAIEPGQTDDPVRIRLYARKGTAIISITETVTTVPRNRVALLRMPIEWLSVGMVTPTDDTTSAGGAGGTSSSPGTSGTAGSAGTSDSAILQFPGYVSFSQMRSTCPDGESPFAGTCASAQVAVETLPTYSAGQVFGTGTGNGDGICFDTATCFSSPSPLVITDRVNCLAAPPQSTGALDLSKFSLGLVTADGSGICGTAGCVVPLDYIAPGTIGSGWTYDTKAIHLPPAVCRKLDQGLIRAVVNTTSCQSKAPTIPTCGPWSSVNSALAVTTSNAELLSLCWSFATSACAGIGRCRGGSGFIPGVMQDDGSCTERMRFLCDASLATPEAEGFRSYFANCGAAFESQTCDQLELAARTACIEPEAGTKALGDPCAFGQCGPGLTCLGAVPNGTGRCVQRYTASSTNACGSGTPIDAVLPQGACAAGLLCDATTQRCHAASLIGELCSTDQSCAVGSVCVASACAAAKSASKDCSDDSECGPGLHCIQLTAAAGQCRGPGELGESCSVLAADQSSVIWQENLCDLNNGLRCDRRSQTCQPAQLLAPGAACSPLNTCAGGYCSGLLGGIESAWVCKSYTADGAACTATTECAPPAECLEAACRLHPAFGVSSLTMQPVPGSAACSAGLATCKAGCFDLTTDRNNCGKCGNACSADAQCVAGQCDCGTKQVKCPDGCRDLQTDPNNCGTCKNTCPAGDACMSGVCTPTCGTDLTPCGTVCVNAAIDPSNCGACGNVCPTGDSCAKGVCQSSAGAGGTANQGGASGNAGAGGAAGTGEGIAGQGGTFGASDTGTLTTVVGAGGGTGKASTGGQAGGGAPSSAGTSSLGGAAGSSFIGQCPAVPAAAGSSGTTTPQLTMTAEGYVTSGQWQGYAATAVDKNGSVTSPPAITSSGKSMSVCVKGTVVPTTQATSPSWASLGFNIHQTSDGTVVTASPSSAGMSVIIDNRTSAVLRAQISGAPSVNAQGTDTSEHWCANVPNGTSYIPWPSFRKNCNTLDGAAYRGEPLSAVAIVVPPSAGTSSVAFDYCVNGLGEVGAVSAELVSPAGWVGGDATSTADDPMGIQGGFWLNGDGIAYSAPTANPCSTSGCCMHGQTIVDATNAAWGAELGLDLRRYSTGQPEGAPSACPYRGPADCFDAVFTGKTGGNTLYLKARSSSPAALPKGETDPLMVVPAFTDGWSGRFCFSDLVCQSWSPHCTVSSDWFNLAFQVSGGHAAGDFDLCLTSLKAVDYQ
jgi:hypothetical protein